MGREGVALDVGVDPCAAGRRRIAGIVGLDEGTPNGLVLEELGDDIFHAGPHQRIEERLVVRGAQPRRQLGQGRRGSEEVGVDQAGRALPEAHPVRVRGGVVR